MTSFPTVSVTPKTSPREISDRDSRLPSIWKKVSTLTTNNTGRKKVLSISSSGALGKRFCSRSLEGSTARQINHSSEK